MMKKFLLIIFILSLVVFISANAVERYVDVNNPTPVAPYTNWTSAATSIQTAVDVAVDGDIVWVTNGVYNISRTSSVYRVYVTNAITIQSVNGAGVTVIEGFGPRESEDSTACVYMKSDAVLRGFTLTTENTQERDYGWWDTGIEGVVEVREGAAVDDCIITRNNGAFGVVYLNGGLLLNSTVCSNEAFSAVYTRNEYDEVSVLVNCMIANNKPVYNHYSYVGGTGISVDNYTDVGVVVSNCTISGNAGDGVELGAYSKMNDCTVSGNGGRGVFVQSFSAMRNCIVSENGGNGLAEVGVLLDWYAEAADCLIYGNIGGGVRGYEDASLSRCVVSNNWSEYDGGGVHANSEFTVSDCIIVDNWTEGNGGGISGPAVANRCTIAGNTAFFGYGGGVCSGEVYNCTITDNFSDNGGGVFGGSVYNCLITENQSYSGGGGVYSGEVYNCTIANNSAVSGAGIYGGRAFNSIICGNSSGDLVGVVTAISCSPDVIHGVYGNITNAPLFADEYAGNYRLSSASPCIDRGVDGYVRTVADLDGNPRKVGTVDMGAYEYQGVMADGDSDGLGDAAELYYGTNPSDQDSDGDGFVDGWEVAHGWNPMKVDSDVSAYISSNLSTFGYYTGESVGDLSLGEMMLQVSNSTVNLQLQLMQSVDLLSWTNAGSSVQWTIPVTNKAYFRLHAQP